MALFGLSFGAKKQNNKSQTDVNKNVFTTQNEQQSKNERTTGGSSTTQSQSNQSVGSSATTGQSNTVESSIQQQQQQGLSTSFSDSVLSNLESAVNSLLGGATGGSPGSDAALAGLEQLQSFNIDDYVAGSVAAAQSRQQSMLEESIGQIASAVGGTAGTNSAVALLANRAQNDATAALEGVRNQALLAGNQAVTQGVGAANQTQAVANDLLASLAAALKGGVTQTAQTGTSQATAQAGQSTSTNTQTAESSQQQQSSQTQMFQDVISLITNLLTSNEQTVGTEKVKGSGTTFGGGASLSL